VPYHLEDEFRRMDSLVVESCIYLEGVFLNGALRRCDCQVGIELTQVNAVKRRERST